MSPNEVNSSTRPFSVRGAVTTEVAGVSWHSTTFEPEDERRFYARNPQFFQVSPAPTSGGIAECRVLLAPPAPLADHAWATARPAYWTNLDFWAQKGTIP